jgi:hypothetical protein
MLDCFNIQLVTDVGTTRKYNVLQQSYADAMIFLKVWMRNRSHPYYGKYAWTPDAFSPPELTCVGTSHNHCYAARTTT